MFSKSYTQSWPMIGAVSLQLFLVACAGREANPVAMTNVTDNTLTCEATTAEIKANNEAARRLSGEHDNKVSRNVAVTTVGVLLFPPLLFALDLKGAEKAEMHALYNRNSYLAKLMANKKCQVIPEVKPVDPENQDVNQRIKAAEKSGKQPFCKDVGGYTIYKQKTAKICRIN